MPRRASVAGAPNVPRNPKQRFGIGVIAKSSLANLAQRLMCGALILLVS